MESAGGNVLTSKKYQTRSIKATLESRTDEPGITGLVLMVTMLIFFSYPAEWYSVIMFMLWY